MTHRIHRITLVLALPLFWSCTPQSRVVPLAPNFSLDPVSFVTSETLSVDPIWKIPLKKSVSLKACIRDFSSNQAIGPLHPFTIVKENSESKVTSDAAGCIHWSEPIDFNYFSSEQYFKSVRAIRGEGVYQGNQEVHLAINPWKNASDSIVDLNFARIENGSEWASDSSVSISQLFIRTQELSYSGGSGSLRLTASLEPKIARKILDGKTTIESIHAGRFQFRAVFLQESPQNAPVILSRFEKEAEIESGSLNIIADITLTRAPKSQLPIVLKFELVPQNLSQGLLAYRGQVQIRQLLFEGRPSAESVREDFSSYFKTSAPQNAGTDAFGFKLEKIELSRGTLAVEKNQIEIGVKACLINPATQSRILDHPFWVSFYPAGKSKIAVSEKKRVTSADDGCLYWRELVAFDHYAEPAYLEYLLSVRSEEQPYKSLRDSKKIYISPWKQDMLWDPRFGEPVKTKSSPAQIRLPLLNYEYLGTHYQLDPLMNLTIHRKYRFSFSPVVVRLDPFSKEGISETPVRDGKFKLRTTLLNDVDQPVAFEEREMNISASGVAEAVLSFPFAFEELSALPSRLRIVLEFSPAQKNSGLTKAISSAVFLIPDERGFSSLTPANMDFKEIKRAYLAKKDDESRKASFKTDRSKFETWVNANGLRFLSQDELRKYQLTEEFMTEVLLGRRSLAELAAHFLGAVPGLDIRIIKKIESLDEEDEPRVIDVPSSGLGSSAFSLLQVQTDYFRELIHSEVSASSTEKSFGVGVEGGKSLGIKLFGTGIEGKVFAQGKFEKKGKDESAVGREEKNGLRSREATTLVAQEQRLRFKAKVYRCLRVLPKSQALSRFKIIHCLHEPRIEEVTESWFLVQSNLGTQSNLGSSTMLGDSRSVKEQSWVMLLRGRTTFEQFKGILKFDNVDDSTIRMDSRQMNTDLPLKTAYRNFIDRYPAPADGTAPGWVEEGF